MPAARNYPPGIYRDAIVHPILSRDLCDEHAGRVVARARERGIEVYWDSEPPG